MREKNGISNLMHEERSDQESLCQKKKKKEHKNVSDCIITIMKP